MTLSVCADTFCSGPPTSASARPPHGRPLPSPARPRRHLRLRAGCGCAMTFCSDPPASARHTPSRTAPPPCSGSRGHTGPAFSSPVRCRSFASFLALRGDGGRMPRKNKHQSLQAEDTLVNQYFQESSSPRMTKSSSLQRTHGILQFWRLDANRNSHDSLKDRSPHSMDNVIPIVAIEAERTLSIKRQNSFEMKLPDLPKVDVRPIQRQSSKNSQPDSPVSPLLTSDPKNERSRAFTFTNF